MNSATAVAIADDLPVQGRLGPCEIVRFPNPAMVSIYRDGVLHMRLTGCIAYARHRVAGLYNAHPGHHWSCVDE
jgi:hypothetical protein